MKKVLFFAFGSLLVGCNDFKDATPTNRNTFVRFYERTTNFRGQAIEVLSDGYLIAGDRQVDLSYNSIIIRTDFQGNIKWETEIENSTTNSLLPVTDGYLAFGASIEVNPDAEQVSDIVKTKSFLNKLDQSSGSVAKSKIYTAKDLRVDLIGNALTQDANGKVYATGLVKVPGERVASYLCGIDPASLDTLWVKSYSLINRDYTNAKSAFVTNNNKILWASSAKTVQQNKSYLSIPVATPNSSFVNNDFFGPLEDKFYSGEDITANASGYGIIGTYYNTQAQSSNLYFIRTDNQGNFLRGSELFFDGVDVGKTNTSLADRDNSSSQDTGEALVATKDGGYLLAGTMITTAERGNGGTDILLVRVDAFGKVLWNKIQGGTGDEVVRSVRVTPDDGYILCGTSTIAGLSSVFVMKLNKDGELKD